MPGPRTFDRKELDGFADRCYAEVTRIRTRRVDEFGIRNEILVWAGLDPFGRHLYTHEFSPIYDALITRKPPEPTPPDYTEIPMNTFPFFRGVTIKGQHFLDPIGKQKAAQIVPGDTLELQHEPTNQHDPYAVGAFKDGIRVGYVQKEVSAALAWLLAIKMPLAVTVTEIGKALNLLVNITELKP